MILKNSYERYLRKKYAIPDDYVVVMKRGYVLNEKKELPENNNVRNNSFKIRELVYEDIKSEIRKIHSMIEKANGEIDDLLRLKESVENADEQIYDLQIELVVDDLFDNLSNSIKDLTNQAYKNFILRLNEDSDDVVEYLYNYALLDKEIYSKINLWVENSKNWFVDKLDQSDIELHLQTKSCLKAQTFTSSYDFLDDIFESATKSFFGDVLSSIEDFFSNLKNRIDRLIFNVVSLVQTEVKKIDLKVHGIDRYQIIISDNENICDRCLEMDGQIFNVDDLKIGDTAPPFHPNCGCTMVPYVEEEKEPQDEEEEDNDDQATEYVDASQLEYIGFNNVTDSMVEELNETLVKYNITTKEQIDHFLSQCFVESWHGNGLIEINWRDYPDTSKDREYFNNLYGGRSDLGNLGKDTDDGYNFRGSGYIHLTGRYNYQQFANDMNDQNIMQGADYVAENYAWEAAGWFWANNVQYMFADGNVPTVSQVTYIVNGGQANLEERMDTYNLVSECIDN